jgi:hypothetical protein
MDEKTYSDQDKLRLECEKLQEEIKVLKRPFILQPTSWITIITLVISLFVNIGQYSKNELLQLQAQIELDSTNIKIGEGKILIDSLNRRSDSLNKTISATLIPALQKIHDSSQGKVNKDLISYESKYALEAVKGSNISFKKSENKNVLLATQKEKEGFDDIVKGDYSGAITAFTESENSYNGYDNAYEIALLLKSNEAKMNDPVSRKEVFKTILKSYSTYAPPYVKMYLIKEIKDN